MAIFDRMRGFQGYRLLVAGIVVQVALVWIWSTLLPTARPVEQPAIVQAPQETSQPTKPSTDNQTVSSPEPPTEVLWRGSLPNDAEAIVRNYLYAVDRNECDKAISHLLMINKTSLKTICANQLLKVNEIKLVTTQPKGDRLLKVKVNGEFVIDGQVIDSFDFELSKRESSDLWWITDTSLNNVIAVTPTATQKP